MLFLAGGSFLSFDPGFALWELITMIIFIIIVGKYGVPILIKAMDERENRIKDSLESAEQALARAEKISKDNKKAMREAEVKAQEIRKEAIDEAEALRAERIEKSKKEADKILEDARHTIEQEKHRAIIELREEVAELAIQSASKILESELDEEKNKKLVNNFIDNLHQN